MACVTAEVRHTTQQYRVACRSITFIAIFITIAGTVYHVGITGARYANAIACTSPLVEI